MRRYCRCWCMIHSVNENENMREESLDNCKEENV